MEVFLHFPCLEGGRGELFLGETLILIDRNWGDFFEKLEIAELGRGKSDDNFDNHIVWFLSLFSIAVNISLKSFACSV